MTDKENIENLEQSSNKDLVEVESSNDENETQNSPKIQVEIN